ncbi:hypothetical protein C2S53_018580 [Perilla frutescens var. hirtella]|uniref:Membrane insertase YidC/Oxa/ALB C-terminal domain-containing protein n=1 Tax=Perilla frutescens var. hirtella TaxID=608512 RepID=A0AAD4P003_PERFH|nr:hypothetical protein C2S53_018580 [Perilla frutescens var. hirtella]
MALRRSLTARAKFFYQQQQRLAVPLSHVARHDNDDRLRPSDRGGECLRRRIPGDNWGSFSGSRNLFGDRRFAIPAAYAPVFVRNMSTDGVDVVGEKAVEAVVVPVANEVAAAASGNFLVDAVQYLIDHVHTFTGLNWWASIALSTILIRTLLLPLTIHQLKALSKFKRIRPQVLEIHHAETESSDKSPVALALHRAQMKKLLNEYGINRFTNLASSVTQFIVVLSLYAAIVNMAGKIESFKDGGAFWFTDLTTLDAMHILPFLTTWTFWKALQCHDDAWLSDDFTSGFHAAFTISLSTLAPNVMCDEEA